MPNGERDGFLPDGLVPIFEVALEHGHELVSDRAIDHAMIEAEHQVDDRPDSDRIRTVFVRHDDGGFMDAADAKYRNLRLVDDRCPEQRAEASRIGDSERAAGNIVGREFLATRAF